ncbi:hypothetical protein ACFOZ7_17500 [Natribaculum luteum]|uniref:Uncharacterized protein n=1 Tax=Natribaculum luteum TaxID=1586232 RepID=A0ABD5P371_9EURY|nr:hypothetical protein [Natribaculum luteum]
MSKISTILVTGVRTYAKVQRTIEHSPDFSGPQTNSRDGRPGRSLPAGGFLTG